jgi:hypothetical protein
MSNASSGVPSSVAPSIDAQPSSIPVPTADPTATPQPAPQPTPAPTPRPTPRPTPAQTPTPCLHVAPQLIGEHRNSAAGLWADAGFTGAVTTLPGNGNYVIATQNRIAGQLYPCGSVVEVGP